MQSTSTENFSLKINASTEADNTSDGVGLGETEDTFGSMLSQGIDQLQEEQQSEAPPSEPAQLETSAVAALPDGLADLEAESLVGLGLAQTATDNDAIDSLLAGGQEGQPRNLDLASSQNMAEPLQQVSSMVSADQGSVAKRPLQSMPVEQVAMAIGATLGGTDKLGNGLLPSQRAVKPANLMSTGSAQTGITESAELPLPLAPAGQASAAADISTLGTDELSNLLLTPQHAATETLTDPLSMRLVAADGIGEMATLPGGSPTNRLGTPAISTQVSEVQLPLNDAKWEQAFGSRILWMAGKNIQAASIQLNPADLGPVNVQLSVNNEQANVTFLSQHAVVREAIEAALPRLREMFTESGVNLANVDVSDQGLAHRNTDQDLADAKPDDPRNPTTMARDDESQVEASIETVQSQDGLFDAFA